MEIFQQVIENLDARAVIWTIAIVGIILAWGRIRAYLKAIAIARRYLGVGGSVDLALLPEDTFTREYYSSSAGEQLPVLVFRAQRAKPVPMIIIFHGASPLGEEHPALAALAYGIAAAGCNVCIPQLPHLKRLIIKADNLVSIRSAYEQLVARTDLHNGHVGVMGTSFAGSLLLKVLTTLPAAERPSSVLSYGSYCDLETALRFIVTGAASFGDRVYEVVPDPWGQVIFFYNYVEHIPGDFDRTTVSKLLQQYVHGEEMEVREYVAQLNTPEGELVALLLGGPTPALVTLMEAVLMSVKDDLRELSPSAFYPHIDFQINLLHGLGDTAVPYTEALAMKALLPDRVRLHITGLLSHKELNWGRDIWVLFRTTEGLVRTIANFIYQLER